MQESLNDVENLENGLSAEKKHLLKAFLNSGVVKIGENVQLKDGSFSPIYIDMRSSITDEHPELLYLTAKLMAIKITKATKNNQNRQVLIGIPDAATPLTTATIMVANNYGQKMSQLLMRRVAKEYGVANTKGQLVVGRPSAFCEYNLVDDVMSSAQSKIEAFKICQQEGFDIKRVFVWFDREQGGGKRLQKATNCEFKAVFKISEVLDFYLKQGLIDSKQSKSVIDWISDNQITD